MKLPIGHALRWPIVRFKKERLMDNARETAVFPMFEESRTPVERDKWPPVLEKLVRMVERTAKGGFENIFATVCEDNTMMLSDLDEMTDARAVLTAAMPNVVAVGVAARVKAIPSSVIPEELREAVPPEQLMALHRIFADMCTSIPILLVTLEARNRGAYAVMCPTESLPVDEWQWQAFHIDTSKMGKERGHRGDYQDLFFRAGVEH